MLAPVGGHSIGSSPSESLVTILAGWERLPDGKGLGPIQRSGQVRLGDRLVRMNNVDVTNMTFREIMDLLKAMVLGSLVSGNSGGARLRNISFEPLSRSTKKETIVAASSALSLVEGQSQTQQSKLYSFKSSIRRARVHYCGSSYVTERRISSGISQENISVRQGDTSFVEYEITCHMAVRFGSSSYQISGSVEEKSWTVWKRYSELKELDEKIRKSFGWQMNALHNGWGVGFPSSHVLSSILVGNLDKAFVEQRRFELEQYWQTVQKVKELFDFTNPSSHRYPQDMSSFLRVETNFPGRGRIHPSGDALTSHGREAGEFSQSLCQASPTPSSKDSFCSAPLSSYGNDELNSAEEAAPDLSSHVKDIIFDSQSVPSLRDGGAPTRRRIGGAAKSAFQRNYQDSF
eukprot:CAMPEP_0113556054 /NCGR_PEP_ID=MMETSP0015_2-20120614/17050_1 /TAXON_ID=2838 /ORGANISM="Odontella" /LENGTH=403 /DNA_ID=CAMNT_0000457381 /DNA_START=167 /DNA_END=1381 /DNA_ORIENTATION=- /assembly_acc=CAM_ASM_000160